MTRRISGRYVDQGFIFHYAHREHECHWCGNKIKLGWRFYRRSSIYKFDSDHCVEQWLLHQKLRKQGLVAFARTEHECHACGVKIPKHKPYWFTRNDIYCSKKCKELITHRKNIRVYNYGTITCEICLIEFQKRTSNQKVCSARCARKRSARNWKLWGKTAKSAQLNMTQSSLKKD